MKKVLLSAILFTGFFFSAIGQVPFQNEFLNLDNNQAPPNWTWVVELDDAALQNGRMEAYQVDAGATLRRPGVMPPEIDSISFEWDGSVNYAYWGQSTAVIMRVNGRQFQFWHGFDEYNFGSSNNIVLFNSINYDGSNYSLTEIDSVPLKFGTYHHKLSITDKKYIFQALDSATGLEYFKFSAAILDSNFKISDIEEIRFRIYCTTNSNIWQDNLKVELFNNTNTTNCANNLSINPNSLNLNSGSNAGFTASTSDPNPVYRWQSDLGLGFQDLSNYGQYSGVGSNNLQVANLQLRNHQQKFRVISTSGNCVDTSAVATISLSDTCINVVNDTNFISVTDTLIINTIITAGNPVISNTIKAYPNPTAGILFINTGNYAAMPGYSIRIASVTGQEVYNSQVNQPLLQVPLESLSPEGLFYLRLYDASGALVTTRKIVLQ